MSCFAKLTSTIRSRSGDRFTWQRRRLTNKALASQWKVEPSLISQFLTGKTALNDTWKLRFAQYMEVLPQQIWPSWPYTTVTAGRIPAGAEKLIERWASMTAEEQDAALIFFRTSRQNS